MTNLTCHLIISLPILAVPSHLLELISFLLLAALLAHKFAIQLFYLALFYDVNVVCFQAYWQWKPVLVVFGFLAWLLYGGDLVVAD